MRTVRVRGHSTCAEGEPGNRTPRPPRGPQLREARLGPGGSQPFLSPEPRDLHGGRRRAAGAGRASSARTPLSRVLSPACSRESPRPCSDMPPQAPRHLLPRPPLATPSLPPLAGRAQPREAAALLAPPPAPGSPARPRLLTDGPLSQPGRGGAWWSAANGRSRRADGRARGGAGAGPAESPPPAPCACSPSRTRRGRSPCAGRTARPRPRPRPAPASAPAPGAVAPVSGECGPGSAGPRALPAPRRQPYARRGPGARGRRA